MRVEDRKSKFKLERESIIGNTAVSGLDGLFNFLWIYVPEAYVVGAQLLEHLAGTNPRPHRPASDSESSLEGEGASFRVVSGPMS